MPEAVGAGMTTEIATKAGNQSPSQSSQGHGERATTIDQALVNAAQGGDQSAFEGLVEIHGPRL